MSEPRRLWDSLGRVKEEWFAGERTLHVAYVPEEPPYIWDEDVEDHPLLTKQQKVRIWEAQQRLNREHVDAERGR